MRIFNDYIEYSAGVSSSTAGMSIGLSYSTLIPPTNGLIVQGNVGINTTLTNQAALSVQNGFLLYTGIATINSPLDLNSNLIDYYNRAGTQGQVLTAIGNGVAWSSLIQEGIVTGTILANQVAYGAGNSQIQGSNNLWFTGTFLGINTITPTTQLHVNGNTRFQGGIYDSNANIGLAGSILASTGSAVVWQAANNGNVTGNFVASEIIFAANSTTLTGVTTFVYNGLGSVGVGTATPQYFLTVFGNANITNTLLLNNGYVNQGTGINTNVRITGSLFDTNNSTGSNNWVLTSNGTNIVWNPASNVGILTGLGTPNTVPKYGAVGGSLVNSSITDTGTLVTISSQTSITGLTTINNSLNVANYLLDYYNRAGTQGQVLTAMGNPGVAWSSVASLGIVTAAGTLNTVSKFGPNNTIVNSAISDNGSVITITENTIFTNGYINQGTGVNTSIRITGTFADSTSAVGAAGQILTSTVTGVAWSALTFLGIVTGYGTPNAIPKFGTAGGSLVNSSISDNGTNVTITEPTTVSNALLVSGGNLTVNQNLYIQGTAIISGGLTVLGTSTIVQTQYLNVYDPIISIGNESVSYDTYLRGIVMEYFPVTGIGTTGFLGAFAPNYDTFTYYSQMQYAGTAPTNASFIQLGNSRFQTGFYLGNVYISGTGVATNLTVTNYALLQSGYTNQGTGINTNLRLTGTFADSTNSVGVAGQILTSTVTGVAWSSVSFLGFLTGYGTPNTLAKYGAVGGSLTNSSISDNGTIVTVTENVVFTTGYINQGTGINTNLRLTGTFADSTNTVGVSGQILTSTQTGVAWSALTFLGIVTGYGTPNTLTKYGAAGGSLVNSSISDNGTLVTVTENVVFTTGYINQGTGINTTLRLTGSLFDTNNSAGSSNWILTSTGSTIVWNPVSNIGILTGLGTPNTVPKYGAVGGSLVNSSISDNGTTVTITEGLNVSGIAITGLTFYGFGTFITNLNASNLFSGTVPSSVVSGTYSGISSVGTLSSLNVTGITSVNAMYHKGIFYDINSLSGLTGQILTSLSYGVAWSSISQIGIVTGLGNPNTIAKFGTPGGTITNSSISDNGTLVTVTENVVFTTGYINQGTGINTNIRLTGTFADASNSVGLLGQFLSSTGTGVAWSSIASIGVTTGVVGATQVAFGQGNNALLGVSTFVYANSNFGVGTALPQSAMHVVGTSRIDGTFIVNATSADLRNQRVFAAANLSTSLVSYTGIASIFVPPGYCITIEGKINGFSTSLIFSECGKYVSSFYNTGPGVVIIDTVDIWSKYSGTSSGNFTVTGIGSYATIVVRSDATASLWYWRTSYDYLLSQNS